MTTDLTQAGVYDWHQHDDFSAAVTQPIVTAAPGVAARSALRFGILGAVLATLALLLAVTAILLAVNASSSASRGVQRVQVGTQPCVTVPAGNNQRELYCRSDVLPR